MDRLDPDTTAILVVDVQEKLAAAMPEDAIATLVKNTGILSRPRRRSAYACSSSEQYPKGLGPTVPAIAEKLAAIGVTPMAKMTFDACSDLTFARALSDTEARAVVVVGMEAHVCVFQTARELVKRGYATHVVADAVASRREENRRLGLALCERAGAVVTATETVAFDLLARAGTDAFKTVSKLLR